MASFRVVLSGQNSLLSTVTAQSNHCREWPAREDPQSVFRTSGNYAALLDEKQDNCVYQVEVSISRATMVTPTFLKTRLGRPC